MLSAVGSFALRVVGSCGRRVVGSCGPGRCRCADPRRVVGSCGRRVVGSCGSGRCRFANPRRVVGSPGQHVIGSCGPERRRCDDPRRIVCLSCLVSHVTRTRPQARQAGAGRGAAQTAPPAGCSLGSCRQVQRGHRRGRVRVLPRAGVS